MPISPYWKSIRDDLGPRLLMMPGVTAVVFDDQGRLLLTERSDNGRWTLIGGMMDPGEQPAETAVREVYEETAVRVEVERVLSVGTMAPTTYPNGDRCEYVDITFRCRAVGGDARVNDDESLRVGWFALDDLPPLGGPCLHRVEMAVRPDAGTWFATVPDVVA